MPYTKEQLAAFVKELELPEDKAKLVLDSIGSDEKVLDRFGGHILRQSDYSDKMNALQKEKEKLEADFKKRQEEEDRFHDANVKWYEKNSKESSDATKAREEAEGRLAAARDRIKKLAEAHGIPDEEIKDLMTAAPITRDRDPESGRFVPKEFEDRINKLLRSEGLQYAKLIDIYDELRDEYRELYGKDAPRPNFDEIIDASAKSGKGVRAVFEEKYNMAAKRREAAEAKHKQDIADAEKRGATQATSKLLSEHPELTSPPLNRERQGSPVLQVARSHEQKDQKDHKPTSQMDTVRAAVDAFNSGKYKGGEEHAA